MRRLTGAVTSNKMEKTVVVRVDHLEKHKKYQKYFRVSRKFKAHDEKNEYKTGDIVIIEEARPLSKEKRWRVALLVKRPEVVTDEVGEEEKTNV